MLLPDGQSLFDPGGGPFPRLLKSTILVWITGASL